MNKKLFLLTLSVTSTSMGKTPLESATPFDEAAEIATPALTDQLIEDMVKTKPLGKVKEYLIIVGEDLSDAKYANSTEVIKKLQQINDQDKKERIKWQEIETKKNVANEAIKKVELATQQLKALNQKLKEATKEKATKITLEIKEATQKAVTTIQDKAKAMGEKIQVTKENLNQQAKNFTNNLKESANKLGDQAKKLGQKIKMFGKRFKK